MLLSLIVAYDKNRVIGHGGSLPWDIPADMKYFREKTRGKPVIMGRKTHESIGRALPKRLNIVVTRQVDYRPTNGCEVATSLAFALARAEVWAKEQGTGEIMVIGGGELYRQALPLATRVYATEIEAEFPGDATFPALEPSEWRVITNEYLQDKETADIPIAFKTYERI